MTAPRVPGDAGTGAPAARMTGRAAVAEHPLSGNVTEVRLDGGQAVVVKHGEGPGAVEAEAAGLRWLADAGAVRVPVVFGREAGRLVVEKVPAGRPDARAAQRFGRDLAALHAAGAPAFGVPPPGGPEDAWIGLAPMRNVPGERWPRWYAEHRVLPYLRLAADSGALRPGEAAVVESVCERLPALAGPAEPPARLHGDLWNGNVLWGADGQAWLIDPAAHGAPRERPRHAAAVRLPVPGAGRRRLPAGCTARRRLAAPCPAPPALPAPRARGAVRPRLRRGGALGGAGGPRRLTGVTWRAAAPAVASGRCRWPSPWRSAMPC